MTKNQKPETDPYDKAANAPFWVKAVAFTAIAIAFVIEPRRTWRAIRGDR